MTLSIDILFGLFMAAAALAIKPGPHMMTFISMAMAGRLRAILFFGTGSAIAGGLMYGFFLKTFSLIPDNFGFVFIFIKATAAVLFVNLGFMGLKNALQNEERISKEPEVTVSKQGLIKNFLSGFLLNISNPYNVVFILTAIPALTGLKNFSWGNIGAIYLMFWLAHVLVITGYVGPILFLRSLLNQKILRWMNIVSSTIMVLIGLLLFANVIIQFDLREAGLLGA